MPGAFVLFLSNNKRRPFLAGFSPLEFPLWFVQIVAAKGLEQSFIPRE